MGKLVGGILMLGFGALLFVWLLYNLLFARQKEFKIGFCGIAFLVALVSVGYNWVSEGYSNLQQDARSKRRRKKKRRLPVTPIEDEDEEDERPRKRRRPRDSDDDDY